MKNGGKHISLWDWKYLYAFNILTDCICILELVYLLRSNYFLRLCMCSGVSTSRLGQYPRACIVDLDHHLVAPSLQMPTLFMSKQVSHI